MLAITQCSELFKDRKICLIHYFTITLTLHISYLTIPPLPQVLTDDTEEGGTSPTEQEAAHAAALRRRTGALERENRALREEAARLAAGADSAELAEQQLLRDIAHQLSKWS